MLKPHHHISITGEMCADLSMWRIFLNKPEIYSRPFMDYKFSNPDEVQFYMDASRNFSLGFGGWCDSDWIYAQWDEVIRHIEPSIEYLELFILTVGILLWVERFQNRRIYIFCDNMSVVYMINNMSSSCKNCMVLIRMVTLECMCHNVRLFAKHMSSADNGIADSLSRLDLTRFYSLTGHMNMCPIPAAIPEKLWPLSKVWIN